MTLIDKDESALFNYYADEFDFPERFSDCEIDTALRTTTWMYPEKYNALDLVQYFSAFCTTELELNRIHEELKLYNTLNLEQLLRWAIWFMDVVKEKNLFIGVGRGSSVSSYCLYLIELHLVDSLKFNLPYTDFLK
jgi:DNA polymerase III alpha subunit